MPLVYNYKPFRFFDLFQPFSQPDASPSRSPSQSPPPPLSAAPNAAASPLLPSPSQRRRIPCPAAGDKRRERREELRRHLAEDADWPRSDGRSFHDCRPAFMQTGPTTAASGSAYAEFGKTKVIVSVFGPRESKKAMIYSDTGRLNCNVSYTTFATPIRGQQFRTVLREFQCSSNPTANNGSCGSATQQLLLRV